MQPNMPSAEYIFHMFVKGKMTPFYDRYYPGLIMYGLRLLGPELEWLAEDCVQDAVLDTFQKRRTFADPGQWRAHLLACIRNRAVSARRRLMARRNYESAADPEAREADHTRALIEHETLDALYAAIKSLPVEYRMLLRLSYDEGLKNAEIAERLGIAEITVKKRKARLLEMLRDRLGPDASLLLTLLAMSHGLLSAS